MKLLDLTGAYCRLVAVGGSWTHYERSYPELFRHYFHFWAKRKYPDIRSSVATLHEQSDVIRRRLPRILQKFESRGFDTGRLSFVLFVGKGCTNGHAMRGGKGWVVWIPVETYPTVRLVDVFVTHEIAHALHYSVSPNFYFSTKGEQRHFARQLLTEGIATFVTTKILGCSDNSALWGGFLGTQQLGIWLSACNEAWPELIATAQRHFDSESSTELFQGNDPSDVFKFRAGYFLGLRLIKSIMAGQKLTLLELLSMSRRRLEICAHEQLTAGF